MTNKEAIRIIKWSKEKSTPKPIKGFIYVYGTVVGLFEVSDFDREFASKYGHFTIFPNDKGFSINTYGISCMLKTHKRIFIPFKYIQDIYLHNYNN